MADEAVVKIVLQDEGGGEKTPSPATVPPPPFDKSANNPHVTNTNPLQVDPFGKSRQDLSAIADAFRKSLTSIAEVYRKLGESGQLGIVPVPTFEGGGLPLEKKELPPPIEKKELPPPIEKRKPPPTEDDKPLTTAPPRDWVNDLVKGIEGANRHVLIEGQSGSGKSVLTRHLAFQRMQEGEEVNVVDTHTPETWKGAKQVFQGQRAGIEAAEFMRDLLEGRKREASEAKSRGEMPDFKPVTMVLSDFARLAKDTPELQQEFKTLLTEARKFRISIVADTTAMTGVATGIKGINDVLGNFGQRVKMYAPTAEDPNRRAIVGGEKFETPVLPEYKDRIDLGLVKPPEETDLASPLGPAAEARRKLEKEKYQAQVEEEYQKLKPMELSPEVRKAPPKFGGGGGEEEKRGGMMEDILGIAQQFRGTIGGRAGGVAGSALDVMSVFKKGTPAPSSGGAMVPTAGGAGGGAMAGAAAAAGPVAIAMAVKEAIDKIGDGIVSGIKGVGNVVAAIATPGEKASETISKLGQTTEGVGKALGEISPAAGLVVKSFGAIGSAVGTVMDALDKTASYYGEFSPDIAQAQAIVEVSRTMADMRRAQEMGPEIARYVIEQGKLQQQFEEAKMKILVKIMPIANDIMKIIGGLVSAGQPLIDAVVLGLKPLTLIAAYFGLVVDAQDEMRRLLREERDAMVDPTTTILNTPGGQIPPITELP